jgi:anti-sigma factor RsiW
MVLSCREIRRQLSNYIDDDISPGTRQAFEAHLLHCRHCAAIVDGTRNMLELIADDRLFALPAGFSERLHIRLQRELDRRPSVPGGEK